MYLLRQNAEKNWKERKKQAYSKKKEAVSKIKFESASFIFALGLKNG